MAAVTAEQNEEVQRLRRTLENETDAPRKLQEEYEQKLAEVTAQTRALTNQRIKAAVDSGLLNKSQVANLVFGNLNRAAVSERIKEVPVDE